MGKPNPDRSPAASAKRDRTKLRSVTISVIHCVEPLLETVPGKPSPAAKVICGSFSANSLTSSPGCQTATRRQQGLSSIGQQSRRHQSGSCSDFISSPNLVSFSASADVQSSPRSHPKLWQIACKIFGVALSRELDSDRI